MNELIEQHRTSLRVINTKYKDQIIRNFELKKSMLLEELRNHHDEWKESNEIHRFMQIGKIISQLSFYNDEDVVSAIKPFGISQSTLRKFVDFNSIFSRLDQFQNQSKHLFPYKIVWPLYVMYSDFLIQDFLSRDYGIDISAIAKKVNRQMQNQSFPLLLKDFVANLNELQRYNEDEFIFHLSEKNTISSMAHVYAYPHKSVYKALYNEIKHFNCELITEGFHEGDYKVDFYHLLEIILRNKGLLNKTHYIEDVDKEMSNREKQQIFENSPYFNERQHKILTVNSILGL